MALSKKAKIGIGFGVAALSAVAAFLFFGKKTLKDSAGNTFELSQNPYGPDANAGFDILVNGLPNGGGVSLTIQDGKAIAVNAYKDSFAFEPTGWKWIGKIA